MGKERVCPYCQSADLARVRFTWWGACLGPWLLRYTRCRSCRRKFALRPGRRRILWIVLYNLVLFMLGAALLVAALRVLLPRLLSSAGRGP